MSMRCTTMNRGWLDVPYMNQTSFGSRSANWSNRTRTLVFLHTTISLWQPHWWASIQWSIIRVSCLLMVWLKHFQVSPSKWTYFFRCWNSSRKYNFTLAHFIALDHQLMIQKLWKAFLILLWSNELVPVWYHGHFAIIYYALDWTNVADTFNSSTWFNGFRLIAIKHNIDMRRVSFKIWGNFLHIYQESLRMFCIWNYTHCLHMACWHAGSRYGYFYSTFIKYM